MSPTSRDLDGLRANELHLERRLPVLEEHCHDLLEILMELVDGGALRVCTSKPWYVPDKQARRGIALDDGCEGAHA